MLPVKISRRFHCAFFSLAVTLAACGLPLGDSGAELDPDFPKATSAEPQDFEGTWQFVWDRGTAWEESETGNITYNSDGSLEGGWIQNISVSPDGAIVFTDDEGYAHEGHISEDKTRMQGTYNLGGDNGIWEADKQ